MNRNRKIFIVSFIVFVCIMIGIAIDMGRRTTAPWNRKKQLSRAIPAIEVVDSVAVDTITK